MIRRYVPKKKLSERVKSIRNRRMKESSMLFGPNGQVYHSDESKRFTDIPKNIKNLFKESYRDTEDTWDLYDTCLEYLGAEEMCDALAKAMGNDTLNDLLDYIVRMYEIPVDENY